MSLGEVIKKQKKPARGALALVGAWRYVPDADIDDVVRRIYSARRSGKARNVDLNG